mmetsp:Transcript_90938/g.220676  ORF Transcript_90938/g.220676 Transcript_90938/m.220676 type:complete len:319 (-) Transcript_90938:141-1097(-)
MVDKVLHLPSLVLGEARHKEDHKRKENQDDGGDHPQLHVREPVQQREQGKCADQDDPSGHVHLDGVAHADLQVQREVAAEGEVALDVLAHLVSGVLRLGIHVHLAGHLCEEVRAMELPAQDVLDKVVAPKDVLIQVGVDGPELSFDLCSAGVSDQHHDVVHAHLHLLPGLDLLHGVVHEKGHEDKVEEHAQEQLHVNHLHHVQPVVGAVGKVKALRMVGVLAWREVLGHDLEAPRLVESEDAERQEPQGHELAAHPVHELLVELQVLPVPHVLELGALVMAVGAVGLPVGGACLGFGHLMLDLPVVVRVLRGVPDLVP